MIPLANLETFTLADTGIPMGHVVKILEPGYKGLCLIYADRGGTRRLLNLDTFTREDAGPKSLVLSLGKAVWRVDHESVSMDGGIAPGTLRVVRGERAIFSKSITGMSALFIATDGKTVTDAFDTTELAPAYFKRWEVGLLNDGEFQSLVSYGAPDPLAEPAGEATG